MGKNARRLVGPLTPIMSTSSHLGMRIAFVAVAIVLWFWTQRLVSAKAPVKNGVGDRLHDWSAPLHA